MRYTISVNQVKTQEWGLNMNEGALMDLINQAYSWAEPVMIDSKLYYWMSRNKVIAEIPSAYSKPDTVYRAFKSLAKKGLVYYTKQGKRDLLALTPKGKTWNVPGTVIGDAILGFESELIDDSEINPSKFGNKSENNSDSNPTYKNTSINKNINNKRESTAPKKIIPTSEQIEIATKYGLLSEMDIMISSFLANGKAKGLVYDCWSSALTIWINREIKIKNTGAVAKKPQQLGALDGWNDRNPDYQPPSQQQEVYHPSQAPFSEPTPDQPLSADWKWTDPFPGMSIIDTDKYIKAHKNKGENPNKAYLRLLAGIQGSI